MSNYSRTNLLSLQFRSATGLRKLTRSELLSRLQLAPVVDPIICDAYKVSEEKILRNQLDDEPHGEPWHVSFHGSQFPGDEMSCPRQALYRMMDFPSADPMPKRLRQMATLGKSIESDIVFACDNADILLSSADPNKQTGFQLADAWLTCSVDAIILPSGWNRPLPIEIKQRSAQVLQGMRLGGGPFPEHVNQLKVEIAFLRLYQENKWFLPDLELVTHGALYYISRDDPNVTAEFRVDYDHDHFVAGVERLKRWRAFFEEDMLPELDPGKRSTVFGHPNGWKWSYPPCQFCPFKKTCQLDFREGETQLSNSNGVKRAKMIRKNYDPDKARDRVAARWPRDK